MVVETIPVNPEIIVWAALEHAGYTEEEALRKFKKFDDWVSGEASPTYCQLEDLAKAFKIPIAVFFFPEPPDIQPINETFRTLPDIEFNKIPRKIRQLLNKAKAFQINLYELCQEQNPSERLIIDSLNFQVDGNVVDMANSVRAFLGITLDQQALWKNEEYALKEWREILISNGIFVFKDKFGIDEYSGFCLYDKEFPLIYVNNSNTKTRQIFTLFHELAHLLFHTSGIDKNNDEANDDFISSLEEDSKKIEIICNEFAAEFLLPTKNFIKIIEERFSIQKPAQIAETLASEYHVSREVILRKLLNQEIIGKDTYKEYANEYNNQRKERKGKSSGNYYLNTITYLGKEYIKLAFNQYYKDLINDEELADYLNIKPKSIEKLEDCYQKIR